MNLRTNKEEAIRFGKFLVVGVINTSVTYIVYVFLRLFSLSPEICNATGYVAGVINSFLWNKKWVFKTKNTNIIREVISFLVVFMISYGVQLYTFRLMLYYLLWNEYLAQFFGMVIYTILNFVLNRFFSFKK